MPPPAIAAPSSALALTSTSIGSVRCAALTARPSYSSAGGDFRFWSACAPTPLSLIRFLLAMETACRGEFRAGLRHCAGKFCSASRLAHSLSFLYRLPFRRFLRYRC
jgi:hypothetical protein